MTEHYGLTASIREQNTGELRTLQQYGSSTEALLSLAAEIDARAGDWKIVCLSSPTSIARDLQGARTIRFEGVRRDGRTGRESRPRSEWDPLDFETLLLGRIGRLDLLQPIPARVTADSRLLPLGQTREERHRDYD